MCMAIAAVASLLSFTATAEAQYYEDKQITVLVNYGAGGTTDILARMIAKHMGKHIAGNPKYNCQEYAWSRRNNRNESYGEFC